MNNRRKAKKVLKLFGKESYRLRIRYIDSFLPESTSRIGSIAYRHTVRRLGLVVLLLVLIMAFATSVYAAIRHYFNFTKTEYSNSDEYISNDYNGAPSKVVFFEPEYIPKGYELETVEYNEIFDRKEWLYKNSEGGILKIWQGNNAVTISVDNERSKSWKITVEDIEVIIYSFTDSMMGMMQIDDTIIMIKGPISEEEMKKIIEGMYR